MSIAIRRIYDNKTKNQDEITVLTDRLWPRGVSKEKANIDHWLKQIAPSSQLRKFYGHKEELFEQFKQLYLEELNTYQNQEQIQQLLQWAKNNHLILITATKDIEFSHTKILKEVIEKLLSS